MMVVWLPMKKYYEVKSSQADSHVMIFKLTDISEIDSIIIIIIRFLISEP
jgi:hypothetical protein